MAQKTFLSLIALVALLVGSLALALPGSLLESKGVVVSAATQIWVRETGLLILVSGITAYFVRADGDSATLRTLLFCNALMQLGLLPIELSAYAQGTLRELSGVVPNSIFHVLAGFGFAHFALKMKARETARVV